jgi:shikimate kinase
VSAAGPAGPAEARPIVLLGLMGVGKSTIGREVARRLGRAHLDSDDELTARHGRDARTTQATAGRSELHRREREVLADQLGRPVVFSAAASVADTVQGRALLEGATVIVLTAPAELLVERAMSSPHRPLPGTVDEVSAALRAQHQQRDPLYRQVASLVLDVGRRSPADLADEIIAWLGAAA